LNILISTHKKSVFYVQALDITHNTKHNGWKELFYVGSEWTKSL